MAQALSWRNAIDLVRDRLEGGHSVTDGRFSDSQIFAHLKLAAAEAVYSRHLQNDERFGRAGRSFLPQGIFTEFEFVAPEVGATAQLPVSPIDLGTEDGLFSVYAKDQQTGRVLLLRRVKNIAMQQVRQDMPWARPSFFRAGSTITIFGIPPGSPLRGVAVTADLQLAQDGSIDYDAALPIAQDLVGVVLDTAVKRLMPAQAQLPDMFADGRDAVPTKSN